MKIESSFIIILCLSLLGLIGLLYYLYKNPIEISISELNPFQFFDKKTSQSYKPDTLDFAQRMNLRRNLTYASREEYNRRKGLQDDIYS